HGERAARGHAQQRAALGHQPLWFAQAEPDGTQAERRTRARARVGPVQLISAEIERAERDRSPAHALHNAQIRGVLRLLVRDTAGGEAPAVRAVHADALGAGRARATQVAGLLDVHLQRRLDAVPRDGRYLAQCAQCRPRARVATLAAPVLSERVIVRVRDPQPGVTVQDGDHVRRQDSRRVAYAGA